MARMSALPNLLLFAVFIFVREYRADLPQKSDIAVVALGDGQNLHLDPRNLSSPQLHLFEAGASGKKVKFMVHAPMPEAKKVY